MLSSRDGNITYVLLDVLNCFKYWYSKQNYLFVYLFVEAVVAESVVVIKKLLQNQPEAHCDIIRHMARLMDSIAVPQARASILWLLGEYSQLVSTIAPDVLRKVAKTFVNEVC